MEQPYRQEAGKSPVPPDRMLVEAGDLAELPFTFARPKSVLPLVAVLGIFCFSILGLFIAGSMELDRFARDQSRTLAQTAVAKSLADVAFVTRDYGFWDAAVENLIRRPDSSWADSNVGTYAWEELGMSRTLVLDSDNTPLYTMKDGETSSQEVLFSVGPSLIRLAERARQTSWLNPEARTSFILLNKRVYLVAASVLTPEEPSPAEIGSFKRGVLIFMRVLDDEHLEEISTSYLLENLTLFSSVSEDDFDFLPLEDDLGRAVGYLGWIKPRPGSAFLKHTAPWVAAILLVLAGFAVMALKRAYAQAATVERLNKDLVLRSRQLEDSQVELLEALDKAEQANRAKADFLAVMSHELRTPLNAVIGFSDLIRNQAFGPVGHQKYIEYGNDIFTSGQHLLSLISDILDITRANAGMLSLDCRPVALGSVIEKCLKLITPQAVRHRISIDVTEMNGPLTVLGDEVRLSQMLINLLSNAMKSSAEASRIRVKATVTPKGQIALRVIDRGRGIPKADLAKVTEPFRQAGTYRDGFDPYASEKAGTGLGLAIVKRLAEAHGGTLHIASKVGLGTVVEIRLPGAAQEECHDEGRVAV
ncbi:ATP-binding protein [Parvibaculum sp.]|uniref:sensor histidine kinase n=1 Tax=Parvibaculum sp. TaxID=2024848 RepID=UPI001B0D80FD|nr:ATP-binding protein [Parvibaculum sp.]MBO6669289.1 hypothetical protein [Parvibaculum sp.]MBO6693664.1 hypothetical protein [Parvibaculum sp.]MBO6712945.1 hypothetical protein [Parvibaculum sp.]